MQVEWNYENQYIVPKGSLLLGGQVISTGTIPIYIQDYRLTDKLFCLFLFVPYM
jgi:hypothetical protein